MRDADCRASGHAEGMKRFLIPFIFFNLIAIYFAAKAPSCNGYPEDCREEGIFIWNHWSVDHFPISYFNSGFADLVFSWGKYNDGYFNCHDYKYDHMVQTGLISGENIDLESSGLSKREWNELMEAFEIKDKLI